MDTDIEQKRIEAYRGASIETQQLYGSVELGGVLGSLIDALKITEENRKKFIDVTGDIILGFEPKSKLALLLTERVGLLQDTASSAAQKILPLLNAVPETPTIPDADSTLKEELKLRPEAVTSVSGYAPSNGAVKPLTREELMNALAAKRTMASDIAAVNQKKDGE